MFANSIPLNKAHGYTLVELIVAMVVGLFLLGGVMFTYVSMKTTTSDTVEMGELQETGRMALDIISRDLEMAGFWGTYGMSSLSTGSVDVTGVVNPGNDCTAGLNNASFPVNSPSSFKYLYSVTAVAGANLGCIDDAVADSDIIQIKRVAGDDVTGQATNNNDYYIETDLSSARIFIGDGAIANPANMNGSVWRYTHHVYYINEQSYQSGDETVTVPVLMRKRLTPTGGMVTESVLEGVENIRLLYGLDNNGDRNVDTYLSAAQMSASEWEQVSSKVLTVQLFALVRATESDRNMTKTNQTYILGGEGGTERRLSFDDNFRRLVYVSTVQVRNAEVETW